jgi:hypothetical protein
MKDRLLRWFMQFSIFLLRGAGWAAVGVFVGFIVSFFFRPTGRVDTFVLTETLLGVVITGLSIVGAFMIALQWSNLDRRIHEFDIKVEEDEEFFDKQAERMQRIATDTDVYIKSTIDDYNEKGAAIYKHFEDEIKIAEEVNSKIDEYKRFYEEKTKEMERKQEEWKKLTEEFIGLRKDEVKQ